MATRMRTRCSRGRLRRAAKTLSRVTFMGPAGGEGRPARIITRSEERRVGKEGRYRGGAYDERERGGTSRGKDRHKKSQGRHMRGITESGGGQMRVNYD